MAIEQFLLALEAGLGHGETALFPVSIFRVKEGVNYNPGDPNYDLFKLAIRVSAKRLFPNFAFLDAPYNLQYYKPGHPETEVGYMGAVTGEDVISLRIDKDRIVTLPFEEAYDTYANYDGLVEIKDRTEWVEVKQWHNYPDGGDWFDVRFSNGRYLRMTADHPLPTQRGRVLCEDLRVGDEVPISLPQINNPVKEPSFDPWVLGVLVCDANCNVTVSLALDEMDVAKELVRRCGGTITEQSRAEKGNYLDVYIPHGDSSAIGTIPMIRFFGSKTKAHRHLPEDFLSWDANNRAALLAGIIDADGYLNNTKGCHVQIGSTNKTLAIEEMLLAQSLGFDARMYKTTYGRGKDSPRYHVSFRMTHNLPIVCNKKRAHLMGQTTLDISGTAVITDIVFVGATGQRRYDVTTASDRFDVSGINSHNCRTRVMGNIYDPSREIAYSRGNLSFTSINLPRLAIESQGDKGVFFAWLQDILEATMKQLLDRFEVQASRKARNFPFLMGQGSWLDSEKLDPDDEVREVLKHGTLSIGFIGLAECLKALIGKHHGESEDAQKLGLEIIGYIRSFCDRKSQALGMNVTCLATPAEGLSGAFTRRDKEKYGIIAGVTDREYYTNSFHVPVYYNISAAKKIALEAPYHALTNAGHITYVEMDGDPTANLEAFEKTIRYMKECGIGYGSVNHPVDRDPVCGYTGIIKDECPHCHRQDRRSYTEKIPRLCAKE